MIDNGEGSSGRSAVRDFNDILDEATGQQERLLTAAFEAGRAIGRREASADLRSKLAGLLSDGAAENDIGPSPHHDFEAAPASDSEPHDATDRRASPGSVKPVISKLVVERPGLSVDEVTEITGFKKNSVRGTLWLLGSEGMIERRGRQWFPLGQKGDGADDATASKDEAVGTVSEPDAPTASNKGGYQAPFGFGPSSRSEQAAER